MQAHLSVQPDLFPRLLAVILNMVLYEESNNQWSLSRPFLALVVVYTEVSPTEWYAQVGVCLKTLKLCCVVSLSGL